MRRLWRIVRGEDRRGRKLRGLIELLGPYRGRTALMFLALILATAASLAPPYLAGRAIGSDARTNGGVFFLWLAPIVLGVGALLARRVPRWQAVWLMGTGLLGSRLFGALPVGVALVVEGILWFTVGMIAVSAERGA